ncbi:MAG: DUF4230 domain-containing protein [Fretibacterium sp.]|nr:DUF4230 domain-containing protein [Fretibacterium sp.]
MLSLVVTLLLVVSVVFNVLLFMRKEARKSSSVRSAILMGAQNVKELATVRERFQSIVSFSKSKKLFNCRLPLTGCSFIMRYSGTIICGSDLSRIEVSERFAVNKVRIVVPRSRILDVYADIHSFEVYDQRAGLFATVRLEEQNREVAADLESMREEALKGDILSRADENARRLLTSLAATVGMEAEIIFAGSGEEPSAVQPLPTETDALPAPTLNEALC